MENSILITQVSDNIGEILGFWSYNICILYDLNVDSILLCWKYIRTRYMLNHFI